MYKRRPAPLHDQSAIRGAREGRNGALDLAGVAHVDRADLHPKRRRRSLDDAELAGARRCGEVAQDCRRDTFGAICLSSSTHFAARLYSYEVKPVALPPGRARLSMKPAPTGSTTAGNTIGTLRVTFNNAATVEAPKARMTSGASAANSAACLRISSALNVAQRASIRTLRPMVQPNNASSCRNAPTRA